MNPIELGKFIASLRNEKHITQEELAERLFIDKRKVSRWECGTSVPEFEMLIKLSEILDVTLYELSICKRITDEKLTTKIVNKFKNATDFKKYKASQIIKHILILLILIFFIIMTVYTFKYNDTIEIYELHSLDEKYQITGTITKIKDQYEININKITYNYNLEKPIKLQDKCNYEIYYKGYRIINSNDTNNILIVNNHIFNNTEQFDEIINDEKILTYKSICDNDEDYSFDFQLTKKFDNKLY